MLIWPLVQDLGVAWSRTERERRLFALCCQVQATLSARYPGYTTPQVHEVPAALVEETQTILEELLHADRAAHR